MSFSNKRKRKIDLIGLVRHTARLCSARGLVKPRDGSTASVDTEHQDARQPGAEGDDGRLARVHGHDSARYAARCKRVDLAHAA